jgi:hypothetical protein
MKYFYSVDDEDFENGSYSMEVNAEAEELDYIAEACADDFYSCHDGFDGSWPRDFFIFNEAGVLIGKQEVHLEYDPSFRAVNTK